MAITADATVNPIVVTGTTAASNKIIDHQGFVKFIRWYKPTAVGHIVSITNQYGDRVTKEYCMQANLSVDIPVFSICDGLYCDDLDSGELYIYMQ